MVEKRDILEIVGELTAQTSKFDQGIKASVAAAKQELESLNSIINATVSKFSTVGLKQQYKQFTLGSPQTPFSEEGGVTSYYGKPLLSKKGTPLPAGAPMYQAIRKMREEAFKESYNIKQYAPEIQRGLQDVPFITAKAKAEREFSEPVAPGTKGRDIIAYNKSMMEAGRAVGATNDEMKKFIKTGDGMTHTMGKIFKRAVETVPVWMAIRSAIQATTQTIEMGIKSIIDLDRELARIKSVTDDVSESDMPEFLGKMSQTIRKLSIDTGLAVGDIAHAFYGFKDAGLSTEVAMAGMNTAVRGSIAMFSDLKETALVLTDIYVQMGESMIESTTPQEKMNRIMADIAVLQKTNKFELNDYIEGLKNFVSAAHASNLSIEQTTFLLAKAHTFMQRGSRGGTELAIALRDISINAKAAGISLGSAINLNTTDKFTIMLNVMEALNKKWREGKDISVDLNTIFGRGQKVMAPMIIALQDVIKQWEIFRNLSESRKLEIWTDQFETATLTLERQVARFQKIRETLGANLVAGLLGINLQNTTDAAEGLSKINNEIEKLIPTVNSLATVMRPLLIALAALAVLRGGGALLGLLVAHPVIGGIAAVVGGLTAGVAAERKAKEKAEKEAKEKAEKEAGVPSTEPAKLAESKKIQTEMLSFYETQSIELDKLEIQGYSLLDIERERLKLMEKREDASVKEGDIHEQKLKIARLEVDELIKNSERDLAYQTLSANRMAIYGKSEIDIQKIIIELQKNKNKAKDEELKLQGMINDELIKYSGQIQTSLASSIKNMMSGTAGLKGLFTDLNAAMVDSYRTTVSDELAAGLMSTGIGAAFGESMISLQGGIKKAHETVYQWIRKGHIDGLSGASGGSSTAGWTGTGSFPRVEGAFGAINQGMSSPSFWNQPVGTNPNAYGVSGGKIGPGRQNQRTGGMSRGQVAGMGIQSAITGYSAYQSARQGGISQGQSIASGVLTGIGSVLMVTPLALLGAILMAAGLLTGMLGGKKSQQTSVETRTTENKISSKIDVTNRNLELVNRNLIGMRQDIRTYILPSSSYFSEKNTLEEQFSLSARRGLT